MDAYAKNFKRNGVNSGKDLVYFGKLEHNRYYTFKDLEVRQGRAKKGDVKPGEQMHVQIIVSRKDATNSIKLSPLNNSKGKNAAHSQKVGQFDRVDFKQAAEKLFDRMFSYERSMEESFRYANTLKHGSYEQKLELKAEQRVRQAEKMADVSIQQSRGHGLLDILLKNDGEYLGAPAVDDGRRRKKKRKRGYDQSHGHSM